MGLLRGRSASMLAVVVGIASAVALVACLGVFLAAAQASMTARAGRAIAVDWQIEVQPNISLASLMASVRSTPHVRAALPVGFAHSSGLIATTGSSTQTTGPAVILGIPPGYRGQWPSVIRSLVGTADGVLVAQQTAANLSVTPGGAVQIGRPGLPPVSVRIDGVVELPQADSLFQKVGAPPGAQSIAPPDNILILPDTVWHDIFDPLAAGRPDLVTTQIHTDLDRDLPSDPATAYNRVTAAAHNFEARTAGGGIVGDNLGAALDAARGDAAYARILFLFLGTPAAVLAVLLTATLVASGAARRRQEQALLRARGASSSQLLKLSMAEALVVGVSGGILGVTVAAVVGFVS